MTPAVARIHLAHVNRIPMSVPLTLHQTRRCLRAIDQTIPIRARSGQRTPKLPPLAGQLPRRLWNAPCLDGVAAPPTSALPGAYPRGTPVSTLQHLHYTIDA